ncbi:MULTISPECIES: RagB/SusD family nutrient uptake outer membrane protein [Niastella]|uniref:RagB/SusD family nutrient uptake outer membrane protein n=1 Tax=Niastella soli TaxID=2821487 RepID=A0ABS3YZJ0_9BACT|nr:RagB/SusD family nutrient uptake outer membrane protein [Niastella soli]MBO9203325.1 RagB/SusD family nutrient uptake outer membrane protein [Niastella soli]
MKRIILSISGLLLIGLVACKKSWLTAESPSAQDTDFVFSSSGEAFGALVGSYDLWRSSVGGMFYDIDVVGSDAETHPEAYDAQLRHVPEGLYATEISLDYASSLGIWGNMYKVANRANMIMDAIAKKEEYKAAVNENKPNDWTQMYGEAAVFRAFAYHNLIRYFGDVPYSPVTITSTKQTDTAKLTSRDFIYDSELANLEKVAPLMYKLGEGGINAERFSRTFAYGLAGKMALYAGGYALRRTDFDYGSVTFTQLGSVKWDAKYVRRTDYKKYYEQARTDLKACMDNAGTCTLITSDTRGAGFNNPFQMNFQYNMNLVVSPESLFEIGETQAQFSERPYAFGRPSNGASANNYPNKAYGQSRMHASFYYGDYDPKDLRRDVTVTVTANSGLCSELIIDFSPGSRQLGGLALNKWDESRMPTPYTQAQRQSGINWPQLRMADVILLMAEAQAELGDEGAAKTELTKVRNRAFAAADQAIKVTSYISSLSGDALKEAILQERKLEFAGEGFRREDLIRNGKLPQKIKALRDEQIAMVNDLKTKRYHDFANGNQIPYYIYTKSVNVSSLSMTKMLTTQNTVAETDQTYPVRFPSWRGNSDAWSQYTASAGNRNLAIKGLFKFIDSTSTEGLDLKTQGYKVTPWGSTIVQYEGQYTTSIFKGYPDAYYSAGVPPRYLFPIPTESITKSYGNVTNGYGFGK